MIPSSSNASCRILFNSGSPPLNPSRKPSRYSSILISDSASAAPKSSDDDLLAVSSFLLDFNNLPDTRLKRGIAISPTAPPKTPTIAFPIASSSSSPDPLLIIPVSAPVVAPTPINLPAALGILLAAAPGIKKGAVSPIILPALAAALSCNSISSALDCVLSDKPKPRPRVLNPRPIPISVFVAVSPSSMPVSNPAIFKVLAGCSANLAKSGFSDFILFIRICSFISLGSDTIFLKPLPPCFFSTCDLAKRNSSESSKKSGSDIFGFN